MGYVSKANNFIYKGETYFIEFNPPKKITNLIITVKLLVEIFV